MEIGRIRKELTALLDNIVEHSNKYSEDRTIPSLEVGVVLTKINRLQDGMSVLRHLLEKQEKEAKQQRQKERIVRAESLVETIATNNLENKVTEEIPAVQIPIEVVQEIIQIKEVSPIKEEAEKIELKQGELKLVDSLTLNDRYLYANELFNKNMNAFNELVKDIDGCSSFDEAQKLYISLDWEIENEHVLSFTSLVERRFS
tara:strand:+ start:1752 stop:2357 length:606 start_codon:yes stop_codon:yes gene_type:complete